MYLRFLAVIVALYPSASMASTTAVGNMLCTAASWASGNMGEGIATLAVIILGVMALLNKISWGLAILHIVGAALLVGASSMVAALGAGGTGC